MRSPLNFLFPLLLFFAFACTSDKVNYLPRHSGEAGELMVIMPEVEWKGAAGDEFRSYFEKNVRQLPQAEPYFKLLHFTPKELSKLLQQHRNIIVIDIGDKPGNSKPGLDLTRDKWSNHQLVFTLRAKNNTVFDSLLADNASKIIDTLNKTERDRLQDQYAKFPNPVLRDTVREVHGLNINFPDDAELVKNNNGFFWIKRERVKYIGNTAHDITQGYLVYSYPYIEDSAFTQKNILEIRDSLLKENIPGPKAGTYMTTEYRYPPESAEISFNGNYAVETRGLWKTENYFMGGPFISLTFLNKDESRVISVSGFVFAPKFDKREYVRELEAVIYSSSFQ